MTEDHMKNAGEVFTDEDLGLLKEDGAKYGYQLCKQDGTILDLWALLARLDGSEDILARAIRRLKLINGDESKCCMNPDSCMNHSLIREYEAWRKAAGK